MGPSDFSKLLQSHKYVSNDHFRAHSVGVDKVSKPPSRCKSSMKSTQLLHNILDTSSQPTLAQTQNNWKSQKIYNFDEMIEDVSDLGLENK